MLTKEKLDKKQARLEHITEMSTYLNGVYVCD